MADIARQIKTDDILLTSQISRSYSRSRIAKARARKKTAPWDIAFVGDSLTWGLYSNGLGGGGLRAEATPRAVAENCNGFISAREDSVFGRGRSTLTTTTYNTYDPKMSAGAGWAYSSAGSIALGGSFLVNTTTANAASFTPLKPWTDADILIAASASLELTADIGAGTTSFPSSSTNTLRRFTYSKALGSETLNLKRVSGNINVLGVLFKDSNDPGIRVHNLGVPGAVVADFQGAGSYFSPALALPFLASQTTVIELGVNEYQAGTLAAYEANLLAYATAVLVYSDVILVSSNQPDPSLAAGKVWQDYVDAMARVAAALSLIHIRVDDRFGGFAVANAAGFLSDFVHMKVEGYTDKAVQIAQVLIDL